MNNFLKTLTVILLFALISGLGFCVYLFSRGNLSAAEGTLLSILLTVISLVASWIISEVYAKYQYQKDIAEIKREYQSNLKVYALKASEKVDNLSNELSRLVIYLQQELESEPDSIEEDNLSKKERIQSAIHIINTLKSVNDKSLSDWKGVIPEELDEREGARKQDDQILLSVINKLERLSDSEKEDEGTTSPSIEKMEHDLNVIKKSLDYLTLSRFGLTVSNRQRKANKRPLKEQVKLMCPECNEEITYKQRPLEGSVKVIKCKACDSRVVAKWNETNGFTLVADEPVMENILCPNCASNLQVNLNLIPGSKTVDACNSCGESFEVTRSTTLAAVKLFKPNDKIKDEPEINDELIDRVKEELPSQPWPSGTAKDVAQKLNIPHKTVSKIIDLLMERGDYYLQFYGKLYSPVKKPRLKKSESKSS